MKLKDISRLCARSHEICICDMHGAQWLGDGHAMYPVFGLPELDVDTAPAVLDFNEEKAEALDVRNVYLEDRYNMREADDEGDYVVHYIDCNIFDKLTLSGIAQTDATLDTIHAAEMEDDDDTGDD